MDRQLHHSNGWSHFAGGPRESSNIFGRLHGDCQTHIPFPTHFDVCLNTWIHFFNLQLSLLMRFRVPTLSDLKRTTLGIIQSTGFLTTSAFTYVLFLCILRKCLGSYNFFTVSYVPAFMSSMCAILIERPSRRGLLCLYVSNVATETLFNMACSRNMCRPIPYGQVMIFGVSIATLLYYYRKGMHLTATTPSNAINNNTIAVDSVSKDSIFDIIRFVVGRHEEHIPLQLAQQPQYMARRRERHTPAMAIAGGSNEAAAGDQRRFHNNIVYSVIMRAIQYYVKCMRYIKYSMPRHRTCPHARNSCVHYALQGGSKLFTIGVGLQVTLKCLLQMKAIFRQPAAQLKKIFGSRDTLKLGAFLGGFAALFRVRYHGTYKFGAGVALNYFGFSLQIVSCSMRHILDRDDPSSAIPAALIASIAFASYPDTTVALYVMWKMLQVNICSQVPSTSQFISKLIRFVHFSYRIISAVTLAICRKFHTSHFSFTAQVRPHYSMPPHSSPPIYAPVTGNSCIHFPVAGKFTVTSLGEFQK